jgi:hypothetical protein
LLVLGAYSALERAVGESLTFTKTIEVIQHQKIISALCPNEKSLILPDKEAMEQSLKLGESFRKYADLVMRVRKHESERQIARIKSELEIQENDDQHEETV